MNQPHPDTKRYIPVKKDSAGNIFYCERPEIILPRIRSILIEKINESGFDYHDDLEKENVFGRKAWFDIFIDVLRDIGQLVSVGKVGIAGKIKRACQAFNFYEAVDLIDGELKLMATLTAGADVPGNAPGQPEAATPPPGADKPEDVQAGAEKNIAVKLGMRDGDLRRLVESLDNARLAGKNPNAKAMMKELKIARPLVKLRGDIRRLKIPKGDKDKLSTLLK
jgi:hypothetical protein